MSKVWLVSSGSYSDYRINAAFSTEARASHAAALWNKRNGETNEYQVEGFDLDPPLTPASPGVEYGYRVSLNVAGGRCWVMAGHQWKTGDPRVELVTFLSSLQMNYYVAYVTYEEARNEPERAKKIGHDRIAQFKAEQVGIA